MPQEHRPKGMTLYAGNRLEDLADMLAQVLDRQPTDPMEPETVIIQSRGMERWVSLALADRLGICANLRFPFPNAFLDTIMTAVFTDMDAAAFMDRDTLTFRMMDPLADPELRAAAPELAVYLSGDGDAVLKAYQFARHLSDRFDQYAVFRPDMVTGWLSGVAVHWQARLWRRVFADASADHRAVRLSRLVRTLQAVDSETASGLPKRVCLFGISTLPPIYTEAFRALAVASEVNLFLLNPCREYWAHIRPQRQIQRTIATARTIGEPVAQWLHLETGNRLLASWGYLGQEYFERLCGMDEVAIEDVFVPPGEDTLLHRLQTDILELRESDGADTALAIPSGDESIQVHACHSPMREVEVLYDHVLHFLDTRPDLTPADILVMSPDIDTYGPLVEAVFGAGEKTAVRVPFHTADRGGAAERPAIQAFLYLLSFHQRRITVSEVEAFMAYPFVRAAWDITEADVDAFRQWIEGTAIRWGIDSNHRARLGLPPVAANTWREGIRRLLMGYAMGDPPGDAARELVENILPYTPLEGSDALRFGRVIDFLEALFEAITALETPRRLSGWARFLLSLVDRFFAAEQVAPADLQFLTRHIHRMAELEQAAAFGQPVSIAVAAAWLKDVCDAERSSGGFLTGGLTVCAMLPMRSIPARIICLLGMNYEDFPRRDRQSGIDLMARDPRPGDRSTRNDDRYLFLEAIVSARDVLTISYVGQSATDNTTLPPSVLVSELVDYMETRFGICEESLVRRHRLQPFSQAYFTGDGALFSYSAENCISPVVDEVVPPLFEGALPEPPPDTGRVEVAELCRFFRHPPRYLAHRRLGIVIPAMAETVEDREPFALSGRARWIMGNELLQALIHDESAAECRRVHLAAGVLAPGAPGQSAYDRLWRDVQVLYRRIRACCSGVPGITSVALRIDGMDIVGTLDGVTPDGRIEYRFGKLRPADRVAGWIRHLLWSAGDGKERPGESRIIAEDTMVAYRPVADPIGLLAPLVSLYQKGLREPLPFLPDPSYTYAARWKKNESASLLAEMIAKDQEALTFGAGGVAADPYVALCWRQGTFFDDAFGRVSLAVCEPMIGNQTP
ncbi:MAG: exodeoxyribonuclease V subunit gamma [Pseudomonadota bacterium]